MRNLMVWAGLAAALYPMCVVVFYLANIATIYALRGSELLTSDMLYTLFLRDAVVCIPIAMFSALFVFFKHRLSR